MYLVLVLVQVSASHPLALGWIPLVHVQQVAVSTTCNFNYHYFLYHPMRVDTELMLPLCSCDPRLTWLDYSCSNCGIMSVSALHLQTRLRGHQPIKRPRLSQLICCLSMFNVNIAFFFSHHRRPCPFSKNGSTAWAPLNALLHLP